jgi:hypothetical protein
MAKKLMAAIFLWPIFSTRNCLRFLSSEPSGRRGATFCTEFLPFLVVTSILWAAVWLIGLGLIGLLDY